MAGQRWGSTSGVYPQTSLPRLLAVIGLILIAKEGKLLYCYHSRDYLGQNEAMAKRGTL